MLLTVASNGTGIALQMVVIVVLSRLLTPAEVGVYSVAAVLTGLAGVLRDFGVGEYLIQEKDLTDEKIRAAITANIAVSWTVCIVLFLLARPMSVFYAETGVGNVLEVLALGFLVTPFGAVAMAFLRREMRFHAMYWATLVSGVGSSAVAIILAYRGFGYMSLAWSSLVSSMLIVVVSLVLRNIRRAALIQLLTCQRLKWRSVLFTQMRCNRPPGLRQLLLFWPHKVARLCATMVTGRCTRRVAVQCVQAGHPYPGSTCWRKCERHGLIADPAL